MTTTEQRREELAEQVIQSLDNGIVPWQRKELPDAPVQGAISGRSYSGLNALSLMERCAEKGYTDPRFITASEANKERAEAQKGQEIVSEAATIPRGLDSNLPNADLSGVQESVLVASDKARTQVSDLRASASSRENSTGTGKLTEAMNAAKKHLGSNAVVTSAVPGKTYSGRIVGIIGDGPDRTAIQAIAGNRAILHDIRNISAESNIRVGEDVKLTADEHGYSAVQGKEEKHKNNKTQELSREGKKR